MGSLYQFDHINETDIAIIAMSCRFPGAENIDEFWQNLCNDVESISFFSKEELFRAGIDQQLVKKPNYVRAKGTLSDVELFDASFFGFSPREAMQMDPQHRLFLEQAWKIIETSGYHPDHYQGLIGLYAGIGMNTYLLNNLSTQRQHLEATTGIFPILIGNDKDYMPTKVSYKLNLKGPSVNVQTACSTSLVATHLACQALINGECDMALAGGVSLQIPHKSGYIYQNGLILSPDGHCRAFDANAKGIVYGNGVGLIMLKRVSDAIVDGDEIHAIIRGSAINNDGSLKVGYTAPSVDGQAAVIAEAQAVANIDPDTITYIETHGTGTALGDPIEIAALTQAFREYTHKTGFCAIGSVKTNIGHLDTAAGVAGIIKTVLALKYRQIPASLNFDSPNPQIDFEKTPFYVNTQLTDWNCAGPRRAGVSSFGFGGTNAHVVLEEAPQRKTSGPSRPADLLVLSAKSESALKAAKMNLASHLQTHPDIKLADAAYTLQVGRHVFDHRYMLVCHDRNEAARILHSPNTKQMLTNSKKLTARPVVFMFPGQGAQYVNMARELYDIEKTFRNCVNKCAELLEPLMEGTDLRTILYPKDDQIKDVTQQLQQTAVTQPAIFVIEYALAKLLMEWGVRPQAVIGHSIGEFTAACITGIFTLEDALKLVATRGKLTQSCKSGSMLSVPLSEADILPLLNPKLSIAAINAPNQTVISGPTEEIDALQQYLTKNETNCIRLHTSHAFHSSMLDPILQSFADVVKRVTFNPMQIRWISTVTGNQINAKDATNPDYWTKNLRQTVRFADAIQHFFEDPSQILLQVGPGQTLCNLANRHPQKDKEQTILSCLRHPKSKQTDITCLLTTLGTLWLEGVSIDWNGFYTHQNRYRVALPTYPFERKKYWVDARQTEESLNPQKEAQKLSHPLLDHHFSKNSQEHVYVAYLQSQKNWELDEHRMLDKAVVPGTAYLEMAVAAFKDYTGTSKIELSNVSILRPLLVEEDDKKQVHIILKNQPRSEFSIRSQDAKKQWQEHVRGQIVKIQGDSPKKHSIEAIRSQCQEEQLDFTDNPTTTRIEFMHYGPRWQNVRQVNLGKEEALVKLKLGDQYIADVQSYTLHPALLDTALGFFSVHNVGACLALSYQKIRINDSIPQIFFSHIRSVDKQKSPKDILHFHITLMDQDGVELVTVKDYTLKKIDSETLADRLSQTDESLRSNMDDWFYLPAWKRSHIAINPQGLEKNQQWLIFVDECNLHTKIIEQLRNHNQKLTTVKSGSSFRKINDHEYTVNIEQDNDYRLLLKELQASDIYPTKIIHLWNIDDGDHDQSKLKHLELSQNRGLHSLLALVKALGSYHFSDDIALFVLTNNMQDVIGHDCHFPEKATLLGGVKIIPQEYPSIRCKSIDIDFPNSGCQQETALVQQLLDEFTTPITEDIVVAYRGNYRWKPTFESLRLEQVPKEHNPLREGGVYLITGGLGGIGLVLAEHLAQKARVNLILTGRSDFPDREEWEQWLSMHEEQDSTSYKIRKIQEIEETGSKVFVFSANVANLEQMEHVISQTKKQCGSIHGVVHCAGVADYKGVIQKRTREDTKNILSPKVKGTLVLAHLLQPFKLDFFIVCSSIGTVLHKMKFGQVGYNAANEFLDAYTYYKTSKDGIFNVSINWDDWKQVGMAERAEQRWMTFYDLSKDLNLRHGAMFPAEGANVFDRILEQSPAPRVIVSTQDLSLMMVKDAESAAAILEKPQELSIKAKTVNTRPELSTEYTTPVNTIEKDLVELWQQFLGIEPIGTLDDFFELGGDSLLGTQIMTRIRETFNVELPIGKLFENPTISGIATFIAEHQKTTVEISNIDGEREEGEI